MPTWTLLPLNLTQNVITFQNTPEIAMTSYIGKSNNSNIRDPTANTQTNKQSSFKPLKKIRENAHQFQLHDGQYFSSWGSNVLSVQTVFTVCHRKIKTNSMDHGEMGPLSEVNFDLKNFYLRQKQANIFAS